MTRVMDLYTIRIKFIPDKFLPELKSLKYDEYLFGIWLSKLQGKRRSSRTTISDKSLNHLNLSNSFLDYGAR